jgi:hypothetical protein
VYVDGANMNALVGVAAPGEFGGDVSHLNLHKTFCIPHGGGGPGVGPVCVVADLVPYLPGHATGGMPSQRQVGAVSAAPLGNAAVLPISWMYIRMMGAEGLQAATEAAILSANYISARLKDHYPTLYASANGHVAHECILDLRGLKDTSGVMAEDVAKRLIDYGFHAPTLSFPVPNTLMVEPTESETLFEIDRFIDAMIAIREEIRQIESGEWPQDNNPLKNAPHTAASLLVREWAAPTAAKPPPTPWRAAPGQVLVARGPRGQRVRRPQPVLQLRAGGMPRKVARGLQHARAPRPCWLAVQRVVLAVDGPHRARRLLQGAGQRVGAGQGAALHAVAHHIGLVQGQRRGVNGVRVVQHQRGQVGAVHGVALQPRRSRCRQGARSTGRRANRPRPGAPTTTSRATRAGKRCAHRPAVMPPKRKARHVHRRVAHDVRQPGLQGLGQMRRRRCPWRERCRIAKARQVGRDHAAPGRHQGLDVAQPVRPAAAAAMQQHQSGRPLPQACQTICTCCRRGWRCSSACERRRARSCGRHQPACARGNLADGLLEHLHRLAAGHQVLVVEDDGRHRVDAGAGVVLLLGAHVGGVLVAGQDGSRARAASSPAALRGGHQHVGRGRAFAAAVVGDQQGLSSAHAALAALFQPGPVQQAVGVKGVPDAAAAFAAEFKAHGRAAFADGVADLFLLRGRGAVLSASGARPRPGRGGPSAG